MKKILIIEDDMEIADVEKDYLELSGLSVTIRNDGLAGYQEALANPYDLILLDLMLPGMDGFEICRKLREKLDIPITIVSARHEDIDKIRTLGFGADEYIEKPFSPAVLAAQVKSQLSRYEQLKGSGKKKHTGPLSLGGITMDESTHTVTARGKPVELANKEFQLLRFLMINAGIVFNRDTLYNRIWGMESLGNTATVPVHINRIREAVEEDPSNPKHILTIWGVGYKFQV